MKAKKLNSLKICNLLLKILLSHEDYYQLCGDLEEAFYYKLETKGFLKANIWYWQQVLKSIPVFLFENLYWGQIMFFSYLKTALRNMTRNKGYSFINITGLVTGMACCLLIFFWIAYELSYDDFHKKAKDLFRIVEKQKTSTEIKYSETTPFALSLAVKEKIPEIIHSSRFINTSWSIQYNEEIFSASGSFVDPDFIRMFTLHFIRGDPETVLTNPQSIVITEELAKGLFSDEEPIGKVLKIDDAIDVRVSGIFKKMPQNSSMRYDYILPISILEKRGINVNGWQPSPFLETFVLLNQNSNPKVVESKISGFLKEYHSESTSQLMLQPVTNIHLHRLNGGGPIVYLYLFSAIACFVLLIACINFMSLATARSTKRAKEVGLRKVIGAQRKNLIFQFFGESILMTFIALSLAIIIVALSFPVINHLTGSEISFNSLKNHLVLPVITIICIFTGIIAGFYPALFLSAFQPVKVLKGLQTSYAKGSVFRHSLVVIQFSLSIIMIICTTLILRQLHFIDNKALGFDKKLLFTARMASNNKHYANVKQELMGNSNILAITATDRPPTYRGLTISDAVWKQKDPNDKTIMQLRRVDYDYFKTFNMKITQGRAFSPQFPTDKTNGLIVNETAVKAMSMKNPVGEPVSYGGQKYVIRGVVKDFHFDRLYQKIEPLFITLQPQSCLYICIRMSANNVKVTLNLIESKWPRLDPGYPFEIVFLDQRIHRLYRREQRMSEIMGYFTIIAVFISCLGLFGLASFVAEQRTKEIGIRKVLGASVGNIFLLMTRAFSKWVVMANLFAWPVAYMVGNSWLQDFAYRVDFGFWIFLFSGLAALFIALVTVSYKSIAVAMTIPIKTIKYE